MGLIAWIVPGLGAGLLASMPSPGKRSPGLLLTCLIGVRRGNRPGGYRRDPPTLTRQWGGYRGPPPAGPDRLVHRDEPSR